MACHWRTIIVRCCPSDGIELMIAKHRAGCAGLAHSSRNPQNFSLIGAAINKVTNKYYFSAVVPECTVDFTIAKFNQQSAQRIRMAVDIADQVITLFSHGFRRRFSASRALCVLTYKLIRGFCVFDEKRPSPRLNIIPRW